MHEQHPPLDDRLYNSRIVDNYVKLLKRRYSYINIDEVLDYAGMKAYEINDQGHWFSQQQIDRFVAIVQQKSGNPHISQEAGRFAASPEAMGVMRQYALGLLGPAKVYERVGQATTRLTKSSIYESRRISHNCIEITVAPRPGVQEKPFQCETRIGFWEAIAEMFNTSLPRIEHPQCMFKGGEVCRYLITWDIQTSTVWKLARNITFLALISICLIFGVFLEHRAMTAIVPMAAALFFILSIISEQQEKHEIKSIIANFQHTSNELVEQIDANYNNARLTNEIGETITSQTNIEDVLAQVVQLFKKRLNYDRGAILLANPESSRLVFRAGFGYNEEKLKLLKKTAFHLDRQDAAGLFVSSFKEQKPFIISDIKEVTERLSPRSKEFANEMGSQSFICCPIVCESNSLGVLVVDNIKSKKPLVESDLSLLLGIAHVIGISLRNVELLDDRNRQIQSILQALAASIDARDPLTAGHSAKVTEYALGICSELNLDKEYCEAVRVAALLHDYGKIGVPDAILKKPGRLTREEYEIVKTHASKSKEILEQINFSGHLKPVPEIAGAHHEKVDGSGYPLGLKGEEIPLGARIIAVADFFEAITAKRHYREPLPLEVAFHLLAKESEQHFEVDIVDAFKRYHRKAYVFGKQREEGILQKVS
ncbi:MAG: HD domain-containing protein [Desulfobacteraceae bacterium]|nr:HD domain-containing protein [Desulfobacteraceae bacterium]